MRRLSADLEREVRRLAAKGHGLREIGRMIDHSKHAVLNVLARTPRPVELAEWNASPAHLSLHEREEIRVGLERGETFTAIAATLGRAVSTVSREVAANGGRENYQAWQAHRRARKTSRRPKPSRLA